MAFNNGDVVEISSQYREGAAPIFGTWRGYIGDNQDLSVIELDSQFQGYLSSGLWIRMIVVFTQYLTKQ